MRALTLDFVQSIGLHELQAVCTSCGARFAVRISAIDLPGETALDAIPALRLIACEDCSGPSEIDLEAAGFRKK